MQPRREVQNRQQAFTEKDLLRGPHDSRTGGLAAAAVPRAGAGALTITTVLITGYTLPGWTRFLCKELNADGDPVGGSFEVRAFSLPRNDEQIGNQSLYECLPNYVSGDLLRIQEQNVWTGTEWFEGWWAVDTFMLYGCQVL